MKLTWRVIEQSGANILTANYKGVVASTKLAMPERWRTMPSAKHFSKLAEETVLQIFSDLAQRDLLTLRSLCHQFARCDWELLYIDLTFSPTDRSVDGFLYVTRHPNFRQHVRNLIYDDTQLVRNLTYRIYFESALPAAYLKSQAQCESAFNEYCRLLRAQQQILDGLSDLLREGLPQLSRLEKLSVIGGPSRSPNCSFKGAARTNSFASTIVGVCYWSYRYKSKCQFLERKDFHDLIKTLSQS
ncbi:hypothetical protein ABVK25_000620 [Lepraria finkii]|uniref:F-box domain-containing protein n=1 Tax=Lepraria finkii TaxID=1340010 RepID=A0ABR4BNM4_9LECA